MASVRHQQVHFNQHQFSPTLSDSVWANRETQSRQTVAAEKLGHIILTKLINSINIRFKFLE